MRENPDGRVPALTPRLFALKEGDRLQIGEKITGHLHARPGQAGRHGHLPRHRHRRGAAQLHALGAAAARAHGEDPLGLLRPLSARPRLLAIHDRLMGQYPNYKYLALTTREADSDSKRSTSRI